MVRKRKVSRERRKKNSEEEERELRKEKGETRMQNSE
jgi:hypothetical protein